jgi:hypothetical protein
MLQKIANITKVSGCDILREPKPAHTLLAETARQRKLRPHFTRNYSWAIPNEDAILTIASYSPLVEIGAGLGLWAHLISRAGGDIVAYDYAPPSKRKRNTYTGRSRGFFPVHIGGPRKLLKHPNRNLLLVWPPYAEPMAWDCLRNFSGKHVLFVGEYQGCTGDDRFFELLYNNFTNQHVIEIPQWEGINDALFIYRRN